MPLPNNGTKLFSLIKSINKLQKTTMVQTVQYSTIKNLEQTLATRHNIGISNSSTCVLSGGVGKEGSFSLSSVLSTVVHLDRGNGFAEEGTGGCSENR